MKFGKFDFMQAIKKRLENDFKPLIVNVKSPSKIQLAGCSARRKPEPYFSMARTCNAAMRLIIGFVKGIWCPGRDSNPHEVTR